MKIKLCIWIGLIAFTAGAATLTIDIPANDVPRLSEAFGKVYNLGHNATVTEMQDIVRFQLISTTYGYEARKLSISVSPTPLAMQPTPTATATATATATP